MRDSFFAPRFINARRFSVPVCLTLLALVRGAASEAAELEQHHAHAHGKVTLNVALVGAAFVIELEAPAANVVGFEHVPASDAEQSAVSAAAKYLKDGARLFGVPTAARCKFESAELTEPEWKTPSPGAQSNGNDTEQHADYEARFTYQCSDPKALTWFEPWLLGRLVHVTETQVNLITPSGQRSEVAKTSHTRISLK